MLWKGKTMRPGWGVMMDEQADEYGFDKLLFIHQKGGDMKKPGIEDRITTLEDSMYAVRVKVADMEHRQALSTPYYPVFKTWRLRKDTNGVACVDCHQLCYVQESNGDMIVSCPTCGHAAKKPTWAFESVLDKYSVYEIPVS